MSNEVNTRKFYQFLANYEKGEQSWTNVADGEYGNADGSVTKAEFRKFLNAEWNGEQSGELNNDLINTFWKKIDTNTSASKIKGTKLRNLNALDKDETANLDKKLEAYVQLNKFVANSVKMPNVLTSTGSQWKWDVVEELTVIVEQFVQNGEAGDIKQKLTEAYPAIANRNTATYCAVEYQNVLKLTTLADYPNYKVADDNTLKSILENFVATIDGNANPEDIKAEVLEIVDAYLATAGIGDDSGYDLSTLGYNQDDKSALNDIQKSVLTQTIKNNLSAIKSEADYEKYPEIFDNAILTFVENKLAVATFGEFESLKTVGMSEFKSTKEYQSIQNRITVDKNFKNIESGSDFYNALVSAFGEDLANTIMNDGRYIKNSAGENIYTAILNNVHEKVANGEFMVDGKVDLKSIQDFIINEISKSLNDFFPNGYGDMSIESLNTMYDKRAEAAYKEENDENSLKQHRQAAIDYCKALAKKSTSLSNAVKEVFGADYTTEINKLYPSEIATKMEDLKSKALEIGDPASWQISSWSTTVPTNLNVNTGSVTTYSIAANISSGSKTVSPDRITYKTNNSCATIENGVLTINAPTTDASYTIEIYAYVDGKKVGEPKVFTLTCNAKNADDMKNENNILVDGQYMKDLISKHNHVTELSGRVGWDEFKSKAKETIANIITQLTNDMITAGYHPSKVNYAAQTTLNYYNAAIDAMTDQQYSSGGGNKSVNFSYVDGNGQSRTSSDAYYQGANSGMSEKADPNGENCKKMALNTTGLQLCEEYHKTNSYKLLLNTGVMLNKFMSFMNI